MSSPDFEIANYEVGEGCSAWLGEDSPGSSYFARHLVCDTRRCLWWDSVIMENGIRAAARNDETLVRYRGNEGEENSGSGEGGEQTDVHFCETN